MGTDENKPPQKVLVDTTVSKPGRVTFSVSGKTPTILARACKALRYFCVSLITLVSGTDLFTGFQSKYICFCIGIFILFTGAVEIFIGVEPEKTNK